MLVDSLIFTISDGASNSDGDFELKTAHYIEMSKEKWNE